jgi:hypothetical protein
MTMTGAAEIQLMTVEEFPAEMLSVRRTNVTVDAHAFQNAGFIKYLRGKIA